MSSLKQSAIQAEALDHARNGQSFSNYPAIFAGFAARGFTAEQIEPRVNVLIYHAWRALGRQVRKGEHGVRICTFVAVTKKGKDGAKDEAFRRPRNVTVFHVSQTDEAMS